MPVSKALTRAAGWLSPSLTLCCVACSSLPPVQAPPQEIRVTEVRYVSLPAADLTPCPKPQDLPAKATNADLAAHDGAETGRGDCDDKLMEEAAKKAGQLVTPVPAPATASAPPRL